MVVLPLTRTCTDEPAHRIRVTIALEQTQLGQVWRSVGTDKGGHRGGCGCSHASERQLPEMEKVQRQLNDKWSIRQVKGTECLDLRLI